MHRYAKFFAISTLALLIFVPMASAGPRIFVRGGFGFWGPGWGWYGPAYWGPGPYGYAYYGARAYTGNVKIETHAKDASVYVDGGYLGLTGKTKKFPLKPGAHDIELRDPHGHTYYQERVQVIPGRTTEIDVDSGSH